MTRAVIDRLMRRAVEERIFPGGVLLAAREGAIRYFEAFGTANLFTGEPVTRGTLFDLASLTKPLATAMAVMKRVDEGRLDIEKKLGGFLPEAFSAGKADIPLFRLLNHTAGFVPYRPYYFRLKGLPVNTAKKRLRRWALLDPLSGPPGEKMLYSDLGFVLLEWVLERHIGRPVDEYLKKEVYSRLKIHDLYYIKEGVPVHPFTAATELCMFRSRLISGAVHDENAWVCGGVQGHAGLFGTAEGVFLLLNDVMKSWTSPQSGRLFNRETVRLFLSPRNPGGRCLGFDRPSPEKASCGHSFSRKSAGHLGFTGTSFWMDPEKTVIVILLTNRVHPSRTHTAIRAFRPRIHDAVMAFLAEPAF